MCKMVATTPPPTPNTHTTPSLMMNLLGKPQDASTKSTKDDKKDMANKNTNNNNKKRVQFFPTCTVKKTISYHDMTDKEIQATWLQQDEEKAIRRRVHSLIRKNGFVNSENNNNIVSVNDDDDDDDDDECMRGLEKIKERRWNRQFAKEEVFEEQDRQDLQYYTGQSYNNSMNNNDDEKIASLYKTCTLKCLISARLIAIQDRNDIQNYIMSVL